jgi:hypothetical protein
MVVKDSIDQWCSSNLGALAHLTRIGQQAGRWLGANLHVAVPSAALGVPFSQFNSRETKHRSNRSSVNLLVISVLSGVSVLLLADLNFGLQLIGAEPHIQRNGQIPPT